ncbi:hypothetical protein CDEST_14844 [Colletotrichum destructivum]|uniref:Aryl-alcohol dehydrogenase n=1 Tax=Colletotrichum destructivum TaxID=34406 RepID=A0AAX4J310_9PEZI|nr:hypothetical protein CDEST_14844 [Colletotrichum destructivum]
MPPQFIPLQLMPQQAFAGPGNDWTGTTDPKERRKMQDRIHQRIRRQRLKTTTGKFSNHRCSSTTAPQETESLTLASFTACEPDNKRTGDFIVQFSTEADYIFSIGAPSVDMLLSLIQFNTTRALIINARVMGITSELMAPDSRSRFVIGNSNATAHDLIPKSLEPTQLQLTVIHHPWIDILPFPEVRDNILRHDENMYDKRELCRDLRGFQSVTQGRGGLIVWTDPWDPKGWEVTEAFASKWPWVIRDCHELLESTTYWRAVRGESQ